jgi:mono/diheme cytochrome c family protein
MKQITILLTLALIAATSLSCAGGENKPANVAANKPTNVVATPLPAATLDELASGRKVYEINCANCHKANGTGGPVEIEGKKLNPDNLTSDKIKGFTDEKIIGYIMNGVEDEGMPAFKGKLSEGEIRDVVKFVRTEIQKMQPASPKR